MFSLSHHSTPESCFTERARRDSRGIRVFIPVSHELSGNQDDAIISSNEETVVVSLKTMYKAGAIPASHMLLNASMPLPCMLLQCLELQICKCSATMALDSCTNWPFPLKNTPSPPRMGQSPGKV